MSNLITITTNLTAHGYYYTTSRLLGEPLVEANSKIRLCCEKGWMDAQTGNKSLNRNGHKKHDSFYNLSQFQSSRRSIIKCIE